MNVPFDMQWPFEVVELSYPTHVVLGPGALGRLGRVLERHGIRAPLVVTDAGVVGAGLLTRLEAALSGTEARRATFDAVRANPTEKDADAGAAAYAAGGCDGIVALGGGSVLDAAKLIQVLTKLPGPVARYDEAVGGDALIGPGLPPLVAIPTTAGTGSEVSRSGVVSLSDQQERKAVVFSPHLMPSTALIDPELTVGLPPGPTAATGMDALTHCVEAYLARGNHPFADALALDGIARVGRSLERVVADGAELPARLDMMIAAMQGAIAFQKGLGASHSLAHALTPISGLHHGLANAVVLPEVMAFTRPAVTARLARIAVALGCPSGGDEGTMADAAVDRVRTLSGRIGLPRRLSNAGVREEDLPRIAEHAFSDVAHTGSPRACTQADLLAIARASF